MSASKPVVCIVIVNFNGAEDTLSCLASLDSIDYLNHFIVVVDNSSDDDSVSVLKEELSLSHTIDNEHATFASRSLDNRIHLVESPVNGGFGSGNYIGINFGLENGADYVLLLNNDTIVEDSFLSPLVAHLESNPDVGIVSGKIQRRYMQTKSPITPLFSAACG